MDNEVLLNEVRADVKKILSHINKVEVDRTRDEGRIKALEIIQAKICSEFEQVKIDVEPAMFLKRYPGIAKAAIIGIIVIMLGTAYSTYNILFKIGNNKYKVEKKDDSDSSRT